MIPQGASRIGFGAGPLGDVSTLADDDAERLVHAALDLGIAVIDTAPGYGASEERVGRALASGGPSARDRVVLVTKGGYGVDGVPDWTPEVVRAGIDQALRRLRTDRIDVFLLHSCPLERVARGDLLAPLEEAARAGKIRSFGYSGDGEALAWSVLCAAFGAVECSVNLVDRAALAASVPQAAARGLFVLAKRAFLSGAFMPDHGREGADGVYPTRFRALASTLPSFDMPWPEIAVRFAAHAPGVTSALVGTRSIEHLENAVAWSARGPLPASIADALEAAWARVGDGWPGVI